MLQLITAPVTEPSLGLPTVALRVERHLLAKRRWRGTAADGQEFGFELERPLTHGTTFRQTDTCRYIIDQIPEPLLEISLAIAPSAAAGIGWAIGNLHLELSADTQRLLAPDEPAMRQLLDRLSVPYRTTQDIFRPGRFARGTLPSHELGPSHRH